MLLGKGNGPAWHVWFPTVRFRASFILKLCARITSENSVATSPRNVPGNVKTCQKHHCHTGPHLPKFIKILEGPQLRQNSLSKASQKRNWWIFRKTWSLWICLMCVSRVLGVNNSDPKLPLHHSHHAWAHTAICQHSCLSPQCCCLAPRHIQRLWSSPPPNLHSTNSGAGWKCYCRPQHGPILWHPRPGKFRRPQKLFEWNAFNDCHRYPNISRPSMWVHSQPIFHTHSQIATLHKIMRPYAPSFLLPVRSKQFWHPNH